jgi:hypothetical protein
MPSSANSSDAPAIVTLLDVARALTSAPEIDVLMDPDGESVIYAGPGEPACASPIPDSIGRIWTRRLQTTCCSRLCGTGI